MQHESKMAMRREMTWRIERLDRDLAHLAPQAVMQQLHAIRALSHNNGLAAVAELAPVLQGELVAHGAEVAIHAYLHCMRDAVDVDADAQPRFVDLALAAIGARLAFA